ncbi:MAG: DUF6541 family protein [Gaiellales bacterium]
MAVLVLGVPGLALVSLLRVRGALPDTLAVPAAAVLGSLVACAATAVQLIAHAPWTLAIAVHIGVSVVLATGAIMLRSRRFARDAATVPVARGWSIWTSIAVLIGVVFAWIVRGTIRLDGLYHVALTRKLIELDEPTFSNINRFIDGGANPVYALPGWHAFIGWCAQLTGSDPIIAWEIMPVLVVALGVLAAAGLARVLLDTPRAEPLGALIWLLARVLFARREVDGDAIRYGAVPGQVVFELVFPVVLAAIAVAMWTSDRRVYKTSLALTFAGIAATVIFHANYLPFIVIIGLGYAVWWLITGPYGRGVATRLLAVGAWVAAFSIGCMAVVLPMLARLDHFGNPNEARIDYHLATTFGQPHIRGGHMYEMLGIPGLLAILIAPVVAWRWRSRSISIAAGGLFALLLAGFVPQVFAILQGTGSLTLGLRINHATGILLQPLLVGALLLTADRFTRWQLSMPRLLLVGFSTLIALMAIGVGFGYTRYLPDWPGYLAAAMFLLLFCARVLRRLHERRDTGAGTFYAPSLAAAAAAGRHDAMRWRRGMPIAGKRMVTFTAALLTLGLLLPVGAISMRRAVFNSDDFGARTAQGELRCLGGVVARELQRVKPGSTVLSDPIASFRVMALAPVYVVGDYKVWNGSDREAIIKRLARVNRFFDSSLTDEQRLAQLDEADVDYLLVYLDDGRWLDPKVAGSKTTATLDAAWSRLDRFSDIQTYDGGSAARLILRHPDRFERLAVDDRARDYALQPRDPNEKPACNAYGLWRVAR